MKTYNVITSGKAAVPRSKRLREIAGYRSVTQSEHNDLADYRTNWDDYLEIVDGAIHVKGGRGFYSDSFISAGGIGSGGGGGGTDLDRVWESLTNNTDKPNVKINPAHIPVATTSTIGGVMVDGTTIQIVDGVISVVGGGGLYDEYFASLQSQIDSVSSRNLFDELTASVLFSDIVTTSSLYAESINLNGSDLTDTLDAFTRSIGAITSKFDDNGKLLFANLPTLYWANVEVSNTSRLNSTPVFAQDTTGLLVLGTVSASSVDQITSLSATQTIPFKVDSGPYAHATLMEIGRGVTFNNTAYGGYINDYANGGFLINTPKLHLSTELTFVGEQSDGSNSLTKGLDYDASAHAWHLRGNFYADGWIASGGVGSGGSGGGGGMIQTVYKDSDFGGSFTRTSEIDTFNAYAINSLFTKFGDYYTKTQVESLIGAINQFHYEIAASTSAVTNPQTNVLYLIGPTGSGADKYEEYVYANNTWTKIGDTSIDLSQYVNSVVASGSGNYISGFTKSGSTLTLTMGTLPTTIALANVTGADDLKEIEALTGTGYLKRKSDSWSLHTNLTEVTAINTYNLAFSRNKITTDCSIEPTTNNERSLGADDKRWLYIYGDQFYGRKFQGEHAWFGGVELFCNSQTQACTLYSDGGVLDIRVLNGGVISIGEGENISITSPQHIIETDCSIVPTTSWARNLGSQQNRWQYIYGDGLNVNYGLFGDICVEGSDVYIDDEIALSIWNNYGGLVINGHGISIEHDGGLTFTAEQSDNDNEFDKGLVYDDVNHAWHLRGNFYADGFVASGGLGSGSSGGIDLDSVWNSLSNTLPDTHASDLIANPHLYGFWAQLQNNDTVTAHDSYKIHPNHLPTIAGTGITGTYTTTGSGSSLATTLTLDISGITGNYLPLTGGTMANENLVTNLNADLLDGKQGSYYNNFLTYYDSGATSADDIAYPLALLRQGTPSTASNWYVTTMYYGAINADANRFQTAFSYSSANPAMYIRKKHNGTFTGWAAVYTALNANLTTVPWKASTLTLNGAATGVTNINSRLYFASSNVGIGNSSPAYKLDITGTLHATGATTLDGNTAIGGTLTVGMASVNKATTLYGTLTAYDKFMVSKTVGDGTGGAYIDVAVSSGIRRAVMVIDPTSPFGSGSDYIQLGANTEGNSFLDIPTSGTFRLANTLYAKDSGNVGIGNSSPSYKLDITGTLRATGAATLGSTLGVTGLTTIGTEPQVSPLTPSAMRTLSFRVWSGGAYINGPVYISNGNHYVCLSINQDGWLEVDGDMYTTGFISAGGVS